MAQEDTMRPENIKDFIGQKETITQLKTILSSANIRETLPDHILISGPPGLGKTSIAFMIKNELQVPITTMIGSNLEKPKDIIGTLAGLDKNQILFIDEVHAIKKPVAEFLYTALEDNKIFIPIPGGKEDTIIPLDLPPFLFIGATTEVGKLPEPFIARFDTRLNLRKYNIEELELIIKRNENKLGIILDDTARKSLASRSQGTPRIVNRLLKKVRDYVVSNSDGDLSSLYVNEIIINNAMQEFGIDEYGLDPSARNILKVLQDHFKGGPVGGNRLALAANENIVTLERSIEPELLVHKLIEMTPSGRVITTKGITHLNKYRN